MGNGKQFRHKLYPDAFFLPAKLREEWFGRGSFERDNQQLGLFKVGSGYSKAEASTKPYQLTEMASRTCGDYLEAAVERPTDLITATGRHIRRPPRNGAIYSRDSKGQPAKARFQMRFAIPVNVGNILNYLAYLKSLNLNSTRERITDLQKFIKLQSNTVTDSGTIPMSYVETPAGRLQGQSKHLQNVPRDVRNAALAGCWDYDIENCHFAIFVQLAKRHGYECPAIRQLLCHKKMIRQFIGETIGIAPEQAKTCLLALLYGAVCSESHMATIPKMIGRGKAGRLYRNAWFQSIKDEVKEGRHITLKAQRRFRGKITNAMGKYIDAGNESVRLLAHLLQGIEAKMLNIVGELRGDSLVLLMHDGFVSDKQLDKAAIEGEILAQTGFAVSLEENHLEEFSDHKVDLM